MFVHLCNSNFPSLCVFQYTKEYITFFSKNCEISEIAYDGGVRQILMLADKGGRGVENRQNSADIVYGRPHI